jgi:hypothetical protein
MTYWLFFVSSGAAVSAEPAAPGVALPSFQPGLWQYRRTLISMPSGKPQVTIVKKCTDPTLEIEQRLAQLRKKSCRFTPVHHEHERYSSSWVCPTPSGTLRFRDVLSAKDTTAYQDASESRIGTHVSQQRIEATRLGDCTTPAARTESSNTTAAH